MRSLLFFSLLMISVTMQAQEFSFSRENYKDSITLAKSMPLLAKEVMKVLDSPSKLDYYDNIFRSALVAKEYTKTIAYLDSIRDLIDDMDAETRKGVGFQFEMYTRAKMQQGNKEFSKAFSTVFQENYIKLSYDAKATVAAFALDVYIEQVKGRLDGAISSCKSKDTLTIDEAKALIRAYNGYIVYVQALPIMKRIIEEDYRKNEGK